MSDKKVDEAERKLIEKPKEANDTTPSEPRKPPPRNYI